MKKRKVFTKTSIIIISMINLGLIMLLCAECDGMMLFITSKAIILYLIYINNKLLNKYMPKRYL